MRNQVKHIDVPTLAKRSLGFRLTFRVYLFDKFVRLAEWILGYPINHEAVMNAVRRYYHDKL
jgi:hypothetical protein